jgi:hypothetical protein
VFLAGGRVAAARTIPPGGGALVEIRAGLAEARAAEPSVAAADAEELVVLASFLRRPPPELAVLPLDEVAISAACGHPRREVA